MTAFLVLLYRYLSERTSNNPVPMQRVAEAKGIRGDAVSGWRF